MAVTVSTAVPTRQHRIPGFNELHQLDLHALGVAGSPVVAVDDFRVAGPPFPPHPHAGFAAVTYVFDDSSTGLRSRSSLGDDVVVGPGGIVWSEAGSGMLHEESPGGLGDELHGVQIFVKLSAAHELTPPRMLSLQPAEVPVWRNAEGDLVRVVVGGLGDIASSLVPIEPFTLLDVRLRREVAIVAPPAHHLVVYVRTGSIELQVDGRAVRIDGGTARAVRCAPIAGSDLALMALESSDVLVLGGAGIDDAVIAEGPFIMSDRRRIADAVQRYRSGAMGALAPSV